MSEINKESMREWVMALMSGNYIQGKATLHRVYDSKETYCCLGVACAIFEQRLELDKELVGPTNSDSVYMYNGSDGFLPSKVVDYLGVDSCNPIVGKVNGEVAIATIANDALRSTFEEIARGINAYYNLDLDI